MVDYVAFNVIIDDIIFPDGSTRMGVLGGGGTQTAFGMRLWSSSVGLIAGVGPDLPDSAREWLDRSGVDLGGVVTSNLPTPRAWQVTEADGRREQIWRVPGAVLGEHLGRIPTEMPARFPARKAFHRGLHPLEPEVERLAALRALAPLVSVEPFKPAERLCREDELRPTLETVDIYSPNLVEARSMLGPGAPGELIRRLFELGGRTVTLRMGDAGTLAARAGSAQALHIPAVPVDVVDAVGAGNAFCGGFVVGWCETGDLALAGAYGAVAASFLVEQVGIPLLTPQVYVEANRRLAWVRERITWRDL